MIYDSGFRRWAAVFALCAMLSISILAYAQDKLPDANQSAEAKTEEVVTPPSATPFTEQDVLSYLEQILSWQKTALSSQQIDGNAREILLADALHQNSTSALGSAFDFSRAQAAMLDKPPAEKDATPAADAKPEEASTANLNKFAAGVESHIAQLQSQLNNINSRLRNGTVRNRAGLTAQREKLTGEINLAKAQQDLIKTINQTIQDGSDAQIGALLKKINNLAKTAPGLSDKTAAAVTVDKPANVATETSTAPTADTKEEASANEGLIQLAGDIFSIVRKKRDIQALRQQTKDLKETTKTMRDQLRTALQNIGKEGNDLNRGNTDVKTLEQQRADLDILTQNFRQLSLSVVPLSQGYKALDTSARTLKEWLAVLDTNLASALRKFLLNLTVLGVALLIPFALSELAKRMVTRYVHDKRRQRQLRILRRAILITVLFLIVLFNLTSEIGSLATFAGFLTAGLAVALQNVILSVVAHFFFFGRYGVRNGDRVTVGGVTGDVTQVGMVRLYLAEVSGEGELAEPTGRIVAFPNSILFQPSAFYKHMR
ncbi:MAG TPA: hypothetical protein VGF14_08350 [Alphaproteobacteria bacterium]